MKIFSKLILFLAVLPFLSLVSCSKEEGEGGKAKIAGTVYKVTDNGDIAKFGDYYTFVRDTTIATDVDVFLIYGGDQNDVYDDKTKTSHNGRFEFDYLRSGDYSVFVYNDNNSYVMRSVHCDKKGTSEVEPIIINEGKNAGKCGIVGKVNVNYAAVSTVVPGVAQRVYLRNINLMSVSDTRTDDEGNFYFSRLDPETTYKIWVEKEIRKNGAVEADTIFVTTGAAGMIVACPSTLNAQSY